MGSSQLCRPTRCPVVFCFTVFPVAPGNQILSVPGQEVQASGPATQENLSHVRPAHQAQGEAEDKEAAAEGEAVPATQVCGQGLMEGQ